MIHLFIGYIFYYFDSRAFGAFARVFLDQGFRGIFASPPLPPTVFTHATSPHTQTLTHILSQMSIFTDFQHDPFQHKGTTPTTHTHTLWQGGTKVLKQRVDPSGKHFRFTKLLTMYFYRFLSLRDFSNPKLYCPAQQPRRYRLSPTCRSELIFYFESKGWPSRILEAWCSFCQIFGFLDRNKLLFFLAVEGQKRAVRALVTPASGGEVISCWGWSKSPNIGI